MPTQTVSETTGVTTGTTAVDLVPVPSSGNVNVPGAGLVNNRDTVAATITLQKITSAGTFALAPITLQSGDVFNIEAGDLSACNATDEKWQIKLGGAVTTNELYFSISYVIIAP